MAVWDSFAGAGLAFGGRDGLKFLAGAESEA